MRICLANDHFSRSSGAAMVIRRIYEGLEDVDFYFAGCQNEPVQEDTSWMPAGRFERFDFKTVNPLRLLRELSRFKRWFGEHRLDLVHANHRRVAAILKFGAVPVLYTGHLAFAKEAWFRWMHPKYMTAVSPSVAANILETTNTPVLTCIGNPVPFPAAPPPVQVAEVHARAVCVARLDPIKGHVHLLTAWKLLHDRGHRFYLDLLGEGSLRPELEAQVKRDGLQDFVRFCGFHQNIAVIVQQSLFAILASQVEGQPLVVLETASLGRASLLTAVPGSVDVLPPKSQLPNGIPFGDVTALADAIERWFAQPDAVVEEGRIFFAFLQPSSNPSSVAESYRRIYLQVLKQIQSHT